MDMAVIKREIGGDFMKHNIIYLYVFDTMADWEIGYLTAELNSGRYYKKGLNSSQIITVSNSKSQVTTMGGLKIVPDRALSECDFENIDALILPGGDTWMTALHDSILKHTEECLKAGTLVAAICGATLALAQKGLLDSRAHTSNDLDYLKATCPNYNGEQNYKQEPCVTDGELITASGIASLEFTVHVLKALDVWTSKMLNDWYALFKDHKMDFFKN